MNDSAPTGHQISLLLDGTQYDQKVLEIIKAATSIIHIQMYIFSDDEFGSKVIESLLEARLKGVAVYILVDSIGSKELPKEIDQKLCESGAIFCRFNRLGAFSIAKWGRRLHHKVVIVDDTEAIVGGINLHSAYDTEFPEGPRLDFAVYVKGPVVLKISDYCQKLFQKNHKNELQFPLLPVFTPNCGDHKVKMLVNDWVRNRRAITKEYLAITQMAQESITIINSYFFPRKNFMNELVAAKKRGVRVRLILPQISDWPSWILASEYLYGFFLKEGIEIYQWEKSILHGKLACVDGLWSTIGSFNLNYTSYQGNLEMNLNIYSKEFSQTLKQKIDQLIETGCKKVESEQFLKRAPFMIKLERLFFYILLSLISNFSLAFIYKENNLHQNPLLLPPSLVLIVAIVCFIVGVVGIVFPILPGIPFLLVSFFLIYKQVQNNRNRS
ncbi:MAG: hypothetical protein HOE90_02045 [Bacteriovoracaceae bacterium]|jgi:cardiolipin synthase A/B|nr:hypothetical protein [Bacteriovoracaceae bacterium]